MSLSAEEIQEIKIAVKEEHHEDEVYFFHTKKARSRCIYVLTITLFLAVGYRFLHHELLARGIDFALGSLIDFLLFGTVES